MSRTRRLSSADATRSVIKTESRGDVAVLTLDRDEKRNALSVGLAQALVGALADASGSRSVLLTGAGSCFCAGADLGEDKIDGDFFEIFDTLVRTIRALEVPVIAYVNGPAIGAGMMLSMACDIRVAAPSARFSIPVGDMAIGVDEWVAGSLASLVGASRARAMLLAGLPLTYDDAVACGYVLAGSLDGAVELAELAAGKAPLTVRNIKREFAPDLFSPAEREAAMRAPFESEDIVEASRARAEKRSPRFTGA